MPQVSVFRNCRAQQPTFTRDFDEVMQLIKDGHWQDEYIEYRNNKRAKEDLPAFSPSGLFENGRKAANLKEHSGILNADINASQNTGIDLFDLREQLQKDLFVYAIHTSVSGIGLSVYFKIVADKHFQTFLSIEKHLATRYHAVVDPGGQSPTMLRYVSFDPDLYINPKAKLYRETESKECAEAMKKRVAVTPDDMEFIAQQIEQERTDITIDYAGLIRAAFAIRAAQGDDGEAYFLRVCRFRPDFDTERMRRVYAQCKTKARTTPAWFLWLARAAGIETASPKTKDIRSAARYRAKDVKSGGQSREAAEASIIDYALTVHDDPEAGKIIAEAVLNGDDEKDGGDEFYEWLTLDVKALKLRHNLLEGSLECNGEIIDDGFISAQLHRLRQKYGHKKVSREVLETIMSAEAQDFHPVTEFFQKNRHLKPTGCIDQVIDSISGAVDGLNDEQAREYRRYFIRKWLLGMISCWHGTYSLLVLVFVNSEHGTGKTKWIRNLLPPELQRYFAEAKMDGDKDHLALMASRLMLFDDEFSGKSRKEHSLLKELSAKQHITIRRPYAKRPERCLRVSVFSGSTNDESILSDPTGNRRILAFHMSAVDWEKYDAVDKTELLMELYHEWRNTGDAWMLTKEDIGILEQAHRPFNEVSPEEELLVKHFEFRRDGEMTNTDIINAMQGKLNGASIRLSQKKLGMVLKKLGHKTRWVKRNGKAAQVYDIDLVDTARVGDFVEKTALPF